MSCGKVSSLLPMSASLAETYNYVAAALCEVHRVRVSLASKADNCYGLTVKQRDIAVRIIILSNHFHFSFEIYSKLI
jgi:hypothetical protein